MSKLTQLFHISIPQKRIYGLDILRALAVLFVVNKHGNIIFIPVKHHIQYFFNLFIFDGVAIFFVLSGFLIGGILINLLEKQPATAATLFNFLKRRWLRTIPNYYIVLLFLLLMVPFNKIAWVGNPFGQHVVIKYFLFIQNFHFPIINFFPESWSLTIEEWFYLIVPSFIFIFVGIFKIAPKKAIFFVATFIILIVTGYRYYLFINTPIINRKQIDDTFEFIVLTRLDGIMYGLAGAYIAFYYNAYWIKYKRQLLKAGIAIILLQKYIPLVVGGDGLGIYNCVFTYTITSIGTILLLPYMSNFKYGYGSLFNILTKISLISYSLYLLNLSPVIYTLIPQFEPLLKKLPLFALDRYIIFWLLTVFGAILLYKCIEIPFMRLRDKKPGTVLPAGK